MSISDAVQPGSAVDHLAMQAGIGARILQLVGFRNHFAGAVGAFARKGFARIAPAKKGGAKRWDGSVFHDKKDWCLFPVFIYGIKVETNTAETKAVLVIYYEPKMIFYSIFK